MFTIKWVKGFTLVELMVVMGVIAVLATSVVLINIPVAMQRSRDGERKSELESIRHALELYRYDMGGYPSGNNNVQTVLAGLAPTYTQTLPNDPASVSKGYYYRYQSAGTCAGTPVVCSRYNLCALLEFTSGAAVCGGNCSGSATCNYQVTNP